ncbi:hypothetical protein RJ640_005140 [Escallonia rubra]|uniref:Retrotransposon gag domain-containing protein n=1 Tax=Escallonia rubra TaxID=112253 RepID=A0AA88S7Q5_9ASTE|nr:hypothetical protein RJ640_005140 [Escallonia rubra]
MSRTIKSMAERGGRGRRGRNITVDMFEELKDQVQNLTQLVKLVGAKLRGPASTWRKHYQNDRDSRRKANIQRWDKMKEKLKAQFLPRDYDQTLYQRVQNLRQHEKTVKEYTKEFHKLSLRSNLAETESQKKVKIQLTRSSSRELAYERNNNASTSRANNTTRGGRTTAPLCSHNNKCFEFGHKSNQCPKRADIRVNLSEDQKARFEENFANFEGEDHVDACESNVLNEEGIEGDVIEKALVIRHSMLAPLANNQDDWLRKNIFRTRCTAEGKLCNLIIDSGSSENLISQEMVEMLKLKTERHPQPYRILWFNKGNEVMVSSTCLVNFSIGFFKEAVGVL